MSDTMRATAHQLGSYRHSIRVRDHELNADEPLDQGGQDSAPSPQELLAASLASCTAITVEMYAARKRWDLTGVEVDVQYTPAERGCPTRFEIVLRLPEGMDPDQAERLRVVAAKCPVHRTLDGEVMFAERVEFGKPRVGAA